MQINIKEMAFPQLFENQSSSPISTFEIMSAINKEGLFEGGNEQLEALLKVTTL